jgi:transcriptional regulator with XRE-family HTH domain
VLAMNVKAIRSEAALSQEKLAELAGFHRTYVSQVERCVTNPTVDNVERLAKVLDVPIARLFQSTIAGRDSSAPDHPQND